jgi:hypothetical protein
MTGAGGTDRAWEDDIVHGLKSLTGEDVPSLEIIVLDAVADWLFSTANPGDGYGEEHAGHLISTLFSALDSARTYLPDRQPEAGTEVADARARVVDGAHELAANGWTGVSLVVSRLMPAIMAELQDNVGARGQQLRGVFVYLLYGLAVGTGTEQDPAVLDGLAACFTGWDAVLRDGYVVPWRRPA